MAEEATQCRNVYIIGAQCTGKTTLVNSLEEKFNSSGCGQPGKQMAKPIIIREVARAVLREKQFSRDDITNSPTRALQLQKYILETQVETEKAASKSDHPSPWYICDRSGLDPIAYAHVFVGEEAADDMLASEAWQELERRMKAGIVILCEAGCSWLVDDGTRLMPDGMEDWMRVDNAFRKLLAAREINYTVCSRNLVSLADRVQLVKELLAVEAKSDCDI
jgi:nicotinamide riboside kinase